MNTTPTAHTQIATDRSWTAAKIPSQAGRRALVTGGNSGIGFHTALELARKGAEVILPARTPEKAHSAIDSIRREVPEAALHPAILDLASQRSVRAFAAWLAEHFPGESLDLLINNAGVMALPTRELTEDGFERQFATNFLGPFALTGLLLPQLKPVHGTRIVTVASSAANFAKIDFDNLQSERSYKPMFGAYAQSKLADLMFAIELQRRLGVVDSPIQATASHPGYAVTNLQGAHLSLGNKLATVLLKPFLSQDAAHGALPSLYAAVAPQAQAGCYFGPDGWQEMKGSPTYARIPVAAQDAVTAKRLWETAERLTGISYGVLSGIA